MELFLHTAENEDPEIIRIEPKERVEQLLEGEEGDAASWIEDVEGEVDPGLTLEAAGVREHGHIHRGRCRRVEVVVRFNGNYEHRFGPATTIRHVHKWAVGPHAGDLSPEE